MSPEDIETLALVGEYHSSKRVAEAWCRRHPDKPITHHAVKARIAKAMRILEVSDRRDAVRKALELTASEDHYPQEVYPPLPLPDPPAVLFDREDQPNGLPEAALEELRDGEGFHFEPLPDLTRPRFYGRLFRRPGERINDLTWIETILNIALATLLLALATYLVMRGMTSWG